MNDTSGNGDKVPLINLTRKGKRPRKPKDEAKLRDYSYFYSVRIFAAEAGKYKDVQVCQKAIISLYGITNRRITTMKKYLSDKGIRCLDKSGRHGNRL
ncbi:hypothetical protein ILUMI_00027 [Ignelater luminosus]|uniref:Uncharacterized protein n=1 Tax=Ignelater luminosus TaxID=2038154 RepID=A0A8K0GLN3_IGNLU|nr:hypothetical protein ILUMI_00027 [Ignelater luminosus]